MTDTELIEQADVIGDATVDGSNTADRVRDMFDALTNNKINNDKIDSDSALATSGKTVAGRDAVKTYIATAVAVETAARIADVDASIAAEETARNTAIGVAVGVETAARIADVDASIAQEVTDRNTAISSATAAEIQARNQAIALAIDDEEIARDAAISASTDGLAPIDSPDFTGIPQVPTAAHLTNTLQAASTAFVQQELGVTPGSITGTVTIDTSYLGGFYICTGTSADYTITLLTAVGHAGKTLSFKGSSALTKIITLDGNGSETVGGKLTRLFTAFGCITLISDGTNWMILYEVPLKISYTPTFVGFTSTPGSLACWYSLVGRIMTVNIHYATSTSNGTSLTVTLPAGYTFESNGTVLAKVQNNSGTVALGFVEMFATGNEFTCFPLITGGTWTASNNKYSLFQAVVAVV